ncbi:hypothetical protein [Streptomyces sp. NPDC093707]|uniref:hypothetical protein n=1 Tax=Streptomyces sp. NPDC093707 TaxID=3154984 RepID=UPI00344D719F
MAMRWGRRAAAAALLSATAMAATAGCGGAAEADNLPKKPPAATSKPVKSVKAQWDTTMEWWALHDIGCLNGADVAARPEGCGVRLQDYVDDVRKIRTAMNRDPEAPKGFYTDAYAIMDRIEQAAASPAGEDDTEGWLQARPLIWVHGQKLNQWIAAHPLR